MRLLLILLLTLAATPMQAAPCGGTFLDFTKAMKQEARALGYDRALVDKFFAGARQDPATLRADRAQSIFRWDFLEFSQRVISAYRLKNGQRYAQDLDPLFDRIEADYGVPRGVLIAFWALETDFGQVQGDFNTLNSLMTLSHDCRRPALFQPQVMAALELFKHGDFDPATTTGAWAGEIGMVQMLPGDTIENGRDGDGDGHVHLKTSIADALTSGAAMLRSMGWRPGEPWLQEITLPEAGLDWSETGIGRTRPVRDWVKAGITARSGALGPGSLEASVILPMGRNGPAFLAYPNFEVYFEWNQSFTYVTTAAYFATRLSGAPIYDPRGTAPGSGLSGDQMKALQRKLAARGHDVGEIDGILGAGTRAAIRTEQMRLNLPADGWPDKALLNRL